MKVFFASFVSDASETGMGKWTHRVAEGLGVLGHDVTLLFSKDFQKLQQLGAVGRHVYPVALALRLLRHRDRFDVVAVHEPSGFWYGGLRRWVRSLPPMVSISYGVESRNFEEMRKAAASGLGRISTKAVVKTALLRTWQTDGALAFADHIVVPAEADRDYLINISAVPAVNISVASSGADLLDDISDHSTKQVLCISSWIPEKGSLSLPAIWEQIVVSVPDARLRVAGAGLPAEQVRQSFPASCRNTVEVLSTFTQDALVDVARGANVFLLPSMREGSPLALLEAMAMGLTPVASRVGGVPEILTGDLRELSYERFDSERAAVLVIDLLRNPERAASLGRLARSRAQELTWARTAKIVESACLQALRRRRGL
jgi:glycosyltransferase involved in cell wall biosynthesis